MKINITYKSLTPKEYAALAKSSVPRTLVKIEDENGESWYGSMIDDIVYYCEKIDKE